MDDIRETFTYYSFPALDARTLRIADGWNQSPAAADILTWKSKVH